MYPAPAMLEHQGIRTIGTLRDLWERKGEKELARFHQLFQIDRVSSVRMHMDARAWDETRRTLNAPRELVEDQPLFLMRDRYLRTEAVLNPLRSRRSSQQTEPARPPVRRQDGQPRGCRWCRRTDVDSPDSGTWVDAFGEVVSRNGRVRAHANWARSATVSGLVFGDRQMHSLLELTEHDFLA